MGCYIFRCRLLLRLVGTVLIIVFTWRQQDSEYVILYQFLTCYLHFHVLINSIRARPLSKVNSDREKVNSDTCAFAYLKRRWKLHWRSGLLGCVAIHLSSRLVCYFKVSLIGLSFDLADQLLFWTCIVKPTFIIFNTLICINKHQVK